MSHIDQHEIDEKRDRDAVSRRYRDARESDAMAPPAALDDAIRAAAHRAVHAGPKLAGSSWIRRWTPQLAVAAVVVLSVSVVFVSIEHQPDLAPVAIQKIALNQTAEPAAEAASPVQANIVEAGPAQTVVADAAKKRAAAETGAAAAKPQFERQRDQPLAKEMLAAPPASTPPPAPRTAAGTPPAAPAYAPPPAAPPATASAAGSLLPAPFPAAVDAAPARKEARADDRFAPVQEAKPIGEKIASAGASRSKDVAEAPAKAAMPIAATAPAAAQDVIAQAPAVKQFAPAPAPAAVAPARPAEADAARRNLRASAPAGIRATGQEERMLADKAAEDERPGPWLKRLLALREQGKFKELRDELVRFRKAHPDVVLPKALTELPAP